MISSGLRQMCIMSDGPKPKHQGIAIGLAGGGQQTDEKVSWNVDWLSLTHGPTKNVMRASSLHP